MASAIVYEGVERQDAAQAENNEDTRAGLFAGMKFWLSRQVPQWKKFVDDATANGAEFVNAEKQADMLLVDHARKNQPPGTYSYRFIEMSLRNGRLESPEDHRVGDASAVDRPVGSVVTGPKGSRTHYTNADDQFLWNMVKPYADNGGYVRGNVIFQEVARLNPRHPFQSWRDRWFRYVQHQNRQITARPDLPATALAAAPAISAPSEPIAPAMTQHPSFEVAAWDQRGPTSPTSTRTRFTAEDNHFITEFMRPYVEKNAKIAGNELYKIVEAQNPRHSWQSWRDRYLKYIHPELVATSTDRPSPVAPSAPQPSNATAKQRSTSSDRTSGPSDQAISNQVHEDQRRHEPSPVVASSSKRRASASESPRKKSRPAGTQSSIQEKSPIPAPRASVDEDADDDVGDDDGEDGLEAIDEDVDTRLRSFEETPTAYPARLPHNFTNEHFESLFKATYCILRASTSSLTKNFENIAGSEQFADLGRSGRDVRLLWQGPVLDQWCSQTGLDRSRVRQDVFIPRNVSLLDRERQTPGRSVSPVKVQRPPKHMEKAVTLDVKGNINEQQTSSEAQCDQCFARRSTNAWKKDKQGRVLCSACHDLFRKTSMRNVSDNMLEEIPGGSRSTDSALDESLASSDPRASPVPNQRDEAHEADVDERGDQDPDAGEPGLPELPRQNDQRESAEQNGRFLPSYSDAGVQTSPVASPGRQEPLSVQKSSTIPKTTVPNMSRKRSLSHVPQAVIQPQTPGKHQAANEGMNYVLVSDESSEHDAPQRLRSGKTGSKPDQRNRFEIPPTPEHDPFGYQQTAKRESSRSEADESPSKRPRAPPKRKAHASHLPEVIILNDEIELLEPAPDQQESSKQDTQGSEAGDIFETAPEVSQHWETAPQSAHKKPARRLSTQALFNDSAIEPGTAEFDLPAPEGGWDSLDLVPLEDEFDSIGDSPGDDAAPYWDTWVAAEEAKYPGVKGLAQILDTATTATSLHWDLASVIVEHMVEFAKTKEGRKLRREGKLPPPVDVKGCWTEEDDNLLLSSDARDFRQVERKHGTAGCDDRIMYLEAFNSV
jgi:hypothetical protein